jgi:hypothetical protein
MIKPLKRHGKKFEIIIHTLKWVSPLCNRSNFNGEPSNANSSIPDQPFARAVICNDGPHVL